LRREGLAGGLLEEIDESYECSATEVYGALEQLRKGILFDLGSECKFDRFEFMQYLFICESAFSKLL
jgi:hypothetical protein